MNNRLNLLITELSVLSKFPQISNNDKEIRRLQLAVYKLANDVAKKKGISIPYIMTLFCATCKKYNEQCISHHSAGMVCPNCAEKKAWAYKGQIFQLGKPIKNVFGNTMPELFANFGTYCMKLGYTYYIHESYTYENHEHKKMKLVISKKKGK